MPSMKKHAREQVAGDVGVVADVTQGLEHIPDAGPGHLPHRQR